tara:strand:+ start:89 stop:493 length:405 start_codon:yes stop_codon:yes gene_type:complete
MESEKYNEEKKQHYDKISQFRKRLLEQSSKEDIEILIELIEENDRIRHEASSILDDFWKYVEVRNWNYFEEPVEFYVITVPEFNYKNIMGGNKEDLHDVMAKLQELFQKNNIKKEYVWAHYNMCCGIFEKYKHE